jgi:hypothetical protein
MGSILFDFLADSLLFHEPSIQNNYAAESENRVLKELADYRDFITKNFDRIVDDVQSSKSKLKVFSTLDKTPISLLKQQALYMEQFVVADPFTVFTQMPSDYGKLMSQKLGYQTSGLSMEGLAIAARYMKEITPMVAANYVKPFPHSILYERPEIPIKYHPDGFKGELPIAVESFFHERARVHPGVKLEEGGYHFDWDKPLTPCRAIWVEFELKSPGGMIYHLVEEEIIDVNKQDRTYTSRYRFPTEPPDPTSFNNWVQQSINQAAINYYQRVYHDNYLASNFGASYLTDNEFTSNLMDISSLSSHDTIPNFTANQLLKMDLPFIEDIHIQQLMEARSHETVFQNFRIELEKHCRDLRAITDHDARRVRMESVIHELTRVQVNQVNNKVKHMRRSFLLGSAGTIGSLLVSVAQPLALPSIWVGIKLYKDYYDMQQQLNQMPAYFLWKVQR